MDALEEFITRKLGRPPNVPEYSQATEAASSGLTPEFLASLGINPPGFPLPPQSAPQQPISQAVSPEVPIQDGVAKAISPSPIPRTPTGTRRPSSSSGKSASSGGESASSSAQEMTPSDINTLGQFASATPNAQGAQVVGEEPTQLLGKNPLLGFLLALAAGSAGLALHRNIVGKTAPSIPPKGLSAITPLDAMPITGAGRSGIGAGVDPVAAAIRAQQMTGQMAELNAVPTMGSGAGIGSARSPESLSDVDRYLAAQAGKGSTVQPETVSTGGTPFKPGEVKPAPSVAESPSWSRNRGSSNDVERFLDTRNRDISTSELFGKGTQGIDDTRPQPGSVTQQVEAIDNTKKAASSATPPDVKVQRVPTEAPAETRFVSVDELKQTTPTKKTTVKLPEGTAPRKGERPKVEKLPQMAFSSEKEMIDYLKKLGFSDADIAKGVTKEQIKKRVGEAAKERQTQPISTQEVMPKKTKTPTITPTIRVKASALKAGDVIVDGDKQLKIFSVKYRRGTEKGRTVQFEGESKPRVLGSDETLDVIRDASKRK